jgi:hypothetical protein
MKFIIAKTEMVTTRSIGNLCPGLSQEQAHGGARQVNVIIIPLYLDVQHWFMLNEIVVGRSCGHLFLPVDNWVWPCVSIVKIMQNAEGIFKCLVSLCNSDVKAKTESTKSCHEIDIYVTPDHGYCSTCRKHFSVLSSFMTYHRFCN